MPGPKSFNFARVKINLTQLDQSSSSLIAVNSVNSGSGDHNADITGGMIIRDLMDRMGENFIRAHQGSPRSTEYAQGVTYNLQNHLAALNFTVVKPAAPISPPITVKPWFLLKLFGAKPKQIAGPPLPDNSAEIFARNKKEVYETLERNLSAMSNDINYINNLVARAGAREMEVRLAEEQRLQEYELRVKAGREQDLAKLADQISDMMPEALKNNTNQAVKTAAAALILNIANGIIDETIKDPRERYTNRGRGAPLPGTLETRDRNNIVTKIRDLATGVLANNERDAFEAFALAVADSLMKEKLKDPKTRYDWPGRRGNRPGEEENPPRGGL